MQVVGHFSLYSVMYSAQHKVGWSVPVVCRYKALLGDVFLAACIGALFICAVNRHVGLFLLPI